MVLNALLRRLLPFDAELLWQRALRSTGSSGELDPSLTDPLRVLLASYEHEAGLTAVGRLIAWNDVKGLLVNRLRMDADRRRCSHLAEERIEQPIFITGMPRTGTTLLHGLMAEDPRLRAPLTWEVMDPSPPPGSEDEAVLERRLRRARERLRWLDWLAPGFQAIHEVAAQAPQECIAITAHSFRSLRFLVTYQLPGYAAYLEQADMTPAYRCHRAFLQQLQFGRPGRRWVLKAPGHLADLDALLEVYPDAVIIQTHRDPLETLPSLASLRVALRSAFARRIDPVATGREASEHWAMMLERGQRVRRERQPPIIDVDYRELLARPEGCLQRLYERLGLPWGEADARRVRAYLARNPQEKHGPHRYRPEDFGLSEAQLAHAFAHYREAMGWVYN